MARSHTPKTTLHTNNNHEDSISTITITHPFHPEKGKEFEYLGQTAEQVRCLDEKGSIRLIPIKTTSLHIPAIGYSSAEGGIIAPLEELLALKELVDSLRDSREV